MTITLAADHYPESWDHFVGQERAKTTLRVAAASAKARNAPMDPVLIASGEPGVGKTSLALLTARELGSHCEVVSGQIRLPEARMLFGNLNDGDVLFIDELHRVFDGGVRNGEWLLHVLQDRMLMGPLGAEPIPNVSILAATTEAGRIPDTIVGRFIVQPRIVPYTEQEAAEIAVTLAGKIFGVTSIPLPNDEVCFAIARAASHNARTMRQIITAMRDLALADGYWSFTGNFDVPRVLDFLGITADGLTAIAQRYLIVLATEFNGTAGAKALQERLNEAGLESAERLLMDKGYLAKTSRGRVLTRDGIRRSRELTKP